MLTKCQLMHIDRTNKITVAREPTLLAVPNPTFGFVLMPTAGTLATCSSFGASEAQDAGLFCLVSEIVDILSSSTGKKFNLFKHIKQLPLYETDLPQY